MQFPDRKTFRRPANWLAAVAIESMAPVLRFYARTITPAPASSPREWKRALIVGSHHIGDLLYRSPSLGHLKAYLPQCNFSYLASRGPSDILEGNPALSEILPWLRSDSPLDIAPEDFAALRSKRFDAILCINSAGYWPELMLALRLGIPNRVCYVHKGFSGWVTHSIPIRFPQSYPACFRDYVSALTGQVADWPLRPIIYCNERDQAEADALWAKLALDNCPHVTASFITSRQQGGIWSASKFGETLRALRRKCDTRIVLCGTLADGPLLAAINSEFELDAEIVAGSLGLRALCCFLRRCSVVFTTDSGPRHIANAAGVPVVFVRNVWSNAIETGPYVDTEIDLCGPPHDGDRGNGATLLAAIDPEWAADVVAAMPQYSTATANSRFLDLHPTPIRNVLK